jgi:hypothetical protein
MNFKGYERKQAVPKQLSKKQQQQQQQQQDDTCNSTRLKHHK